MRTSKNYILSDNKFFNYQKGKKEGGMFFWLPTIITTQDKFIAWDTAMKSFYIGIGNYFAQFNIYTIVRNKNLGVQKETAISLMQCLKSQNLHINNLAAAIEFLNQNQFIIQILKNANMNHEYIKQILPLFFQNVDFIEYELEEDKNQQPT